MPVSFYGSPFDLISLTSPSASMLRGPDGTLMFQAHNLYLNSGAPANQSVTVLNGATYQLVITGTVSVTLSGAATGVKTAGTHNITASTGTLTFGSTSGAGRVHLRRTPSDPLYISTAGAAKFALPFIYALGGILRGIMLERTSTNLLLRSNELATTWAGFQSSATNAAATGPDGTLSFSKFFATATAGVHTRTQNVTGTTNTNPYAFSSFVKAAEYSKVIISIYEGVSLVRAVGFSFDTVTKVFADVFSSGGASGLIYSYEDWGAGIFRILASCTLGGTDTQIQYRLAAHNGTSNSFTGDGVSGIYVGGLQLEAGNWPTSPIFTYGAQVTRNIGMPRLVTSSFPFSDQNLTMFARFTLERPAITGTWCQALAIDDGTANNRFDLEVESASNKGRVTVNSGAVNYAFIDLGTTTQGVEQKLAMSITGTTSAKGARNGVPATEDTAIVTPIGLANLKFGHVSAGSSLDGILSEIIVAPRSASQSELNALTAV